MAARLYARALARSICAEMHSGFGALRSHLPMDLGRDQPPSGMPDDVESDIARVCALWADCRTRFGADGPYLFGHASIADAFYAPVAARFRSYRTGASLGCRGLRRDHLPLAGFQRWYQAALQEKETL